MHVAVGSPSGHFASCQRRLDTNPGISRRVRGGECQVDGGDSLTGGGGAALNGHPTRTCITCLEAEITVRWVSLSSPGPAVRCRCGRAPWAKFGAYLRTFCMSRGIVLNRCLPCLSDFEDLRGAGKFESTREFCCCISRQMRWHTKCRVDGIGGDLHCVLNFH